LSGQFALAPVTDRDIERLRIFTGKCYDLADHLWRERRRLSMAGRIRVYPARDA
jgi:hypothetical protein